MKTLWRLGLVASLLLAAVVSRAESCDAVVKATLEEMRAGAGDAWTADIAAVARAAAGAACVKVQSGRYSTAGGDNTGQGAYTEDAVVAVEGDNSGGSRDAAGSESPEAGGLWPFNPGAVKAISGSPSKKPYERRREN